jgi:hypothetical protein
MALAARWEVSGRGYYESGHGPPLVGSVDVVADALLPVCLLALCRRLSGFIDGDMLGF